MSMRNFAVPRPRRAAWLLLALLAAAGPATAAHYHAQANVTATPLDLVTNKPGPGVSDREVYDQPDPPGSVHAELVDPGLGSAYALSDFGLLRVNAQAHAYRTPTLLYSPLNTARASFSDQVTFQAQGLTGEGIAFARVFLHSPGTLASASGYGSSASVNGSISVRGVGSSQYTRLFSFSAVMVAGRDPGPIIWTSLPSTTPGLDGYWDIPLPFQPGQAVEILIEAGASAYGVYNQTTNGSAYADFSSSLYWGGISAVRVGGTTTTAFTALGEGGADWKLDHAPSSVVPEPAHAALWALGMPVLGWLAARRQRRPRV